MKAEQLSVFLENRAGRLAEVTHTLAEAGVNIRALSLADTSDFGILRLIVDDQEKAKSVLKEHSFTLGRTSVVAVQVPDTPGGLDSVLGALIGGLLIGLIEALAGAYLGGEYKLLATFIVLVVVLLIRPYGLFGTHEIERL